jgi:hypothetical protein
MTQILIFGGGNARAQNHPVAPYIDSTLDSTLDYPLPPIPLPHSCPYFLGFSLKNRAISSEEPVGYSWPPR